MIDQSHFLFHSTDGRAGKLHVPVEVWMGEIGAATWLEYELGMVGEDVADYDIPTLERELKADMDVGRAEWEELQQAIGLADRHGMGEPSRMLRAKAPKEQDFFVPGLLARGGVTLISGREKLSGKSTLVFNLIAALERQDATMFGPAYKEPVKTLVITEEPEYAIVDKLNRFDLKDAWIVQDWAWPLDKVDGTTVQERWVNKLVQIEQLAFAIGCSHVVIDPLSRIAAVEDEAGRELGMRAEAASSFAYRSKLALTLIHHANKRTDAAAEDRFRGSTSLTAAVDQMISIERRGRKHPRRRHAVSYGRVETVNWEKAWELDEDGITYRSLDTDAEANADARADLLLIRSMKDEQCTVHQFCEVLCLDPENPNDRQAALRRLNDHVAAGVLDKEKDGGHLVFYPKGEE